MEDNSTRPRRRPKPLLPTGSQWSISNAPSFDPAKLRAGVRRHLGKAGSDAVLRIREPGQPPRDVVGVAAAALVDAGGLEELPAGTLVAVGAPVRARRPVDLEERLMKKARRQILRFERDEQMKAAEQAPPKARRI